MISASSIRRDGHIRRDETLSRWQLPHRLTGKYIPDAKTETSDAAFLTSLCGVLGSRVISKDLLACEMGPFHGGEERGSQDRHLNNYQFSSQRQLSVAC